MRAAEGKQKKTKTKAIKAGIEAKGMADKQKYGSERSLNKIVRNSRKLVKLKGIREVCSEKRREIGSNIFPKNSEICSDYQATCLCLDNLLGLPGVGILERKSTVSR